MCGEIECGDKKSEKSEQLLTLVKKLNTEYKKIWGCEQSKHNRDSENETPLTCAMDNEKASMDVLTFLFLEDPDHNAVERTTTERRKLSRRESSRGSLATLRETSHRHVLSGESIMTRKHQLVKAVLEHVKDHLHNKNKDDADKCFRVFLAIVDSNDDAYAEDVKKMLADMHPKDAEELANHRDSMNRRLLDQATKKCKRHIMERMFFCGKYKIRSGPPIHTSATCVVVGAVNMIDLEKDETENGVAKESHGVALKFMREKEHWERERDVREGLKKGQKGGIDDFLLDIVEIRDGDDKEFMEQLKNLDISSGNSDGMEHFKDIDTNHDGVIDWDEFKRAPPLTSTLTS